MGLNPIQIGMLRWYDATTANEVTVCNSPSGLAFDGQDIWVSCIGSSKVTRVRPSDGTVLGMLDLGANAAAGSITFDGANLWIPTQAGDIRQVRTRDGAVLNAFPTSGNATALAYDGASLWAAAPSRDMVLQFAGKGNLFIGAVSLPSGGGPSGLAYDGANMWITHQGTRTVTKVRATDTVLLGTFAVGSNPAGIAFDGKYMWIANSGDNTVSQLLANDGSHVQTIPVDMRPTGVAFDGNCIWVTNQAGNSVTKVRVRDSAQIGTFPVGPGPTGIAFDGANIWVANTGGNTISKR